MDSPGHVPSAPPADLLDGASLFLDFDGTLVEIAERPDAVTVDARLRAVVHRLRGLLEGRVAVITGRAAGQVHALLGADLVVVGSHGMEFVAPDGARRGPERPVALDAVLAEMRALAARHAGVAVEDKPLGAALHFRQRPAAGAACERLAAELAGRHGLHLQPGKMMVEVRAGGGDKGTAIRALMREPGMAGTRPVFMGDDQTDEPGFAAAAALGGAGVLVGEPRATAARYRLAGVAATLAWLEAAAAAEAA
jgi:trehalose 6-phosphate phosphatase